MAGAPGQRAGSNIGGIFSNLTRTLNAAKEVQPARVGGGSQPASQGASPSGIKPPAAGTPPADSATAAPPEPAAPPKPAIVYEDAAGIRPGMERAELVRRFGDPAMQITTGPGCESLTYTAKSGPVEVELRDGKVATVRTKEKPKQSAVVRL